MTWKAIAALAENRVIGANGKIPWRLPEDLQFFKKMTTGHTVLMGRKTWDSLGRPLPNRFNVVFTRSQSFIAKAGMTIDNVDKLTVRTIVEAGFSGPKLPGDIWVIGGAQIYNLTLHLCTELYLTHVNGKFEGDTFFPEYAHLFDSAETLIESPAFRIVRYVRKT